MSLHEWISFLIVSKYKYLYMDIYGAYLNKCFKEMDICI